MNPLLSLSVLACLVAGAGETRGAGLADPLERPALTRRNPAQAVFLGVTAAGNRLVATGERGLIALSDDDGRRWRQAAVPVSVTLTGVQFPTRKRGWAIGHAGVVLRSDDGGENWRRVFDGRSAAALALDAARRADGPTAENARRAAERLVGDGPDKPFLTLWFQDAQTGFVAGAFGLVYRTSDGGESWTPWMDHVENPGGLHIYALRQAGQTLYLAGEQGLLLASTDGGQRFAPLPVPYDGTFFSMAVAPDGRIALGGLRGTLLIAQAGAVSWRKVEGLPEASVTALHWTPDGRLLAATQAGRLYAVPADASPPTPLAIPPGAPVAGLLPAGGGLVTVGMGGIVRVDAAVPAAGQGATP